jgi:hypothetical protein
MPKLIWSRQALLDIQRLYIFLAEVNPDAATRAVRATRDGVKRLKQFPFSGRLIESKDTHYRDWLVLLALMATLRDIGLTEKAWRYLWSVISANCPDSAALSGTRDCIAQ